MNSSNDETLPLQDTSSRESGVAASKPQRIGDYELLEVVAHGGMGVVYRARQVSLNRIVAVKMIRQIEFASESDRIRFKAEAEAAAALNHPNTVPIYEVGEHDGKPYFSMRLVEGGSLANLLAEGKWSIEDRGTIRRSILLIHQVALAVHDAHQRGIIHRDLKPGNILIDHSGVPYVADFGLAKRHSSSNQVTQTGAIVGTPAFMSPEQALGKETTTASDVYSLGAVLYNLVGGRPPIQAETPMELFKQLVDEPAKPVRQWNRLVDRDIETICQKCLEKDPTRRYPSALALADDLQNWLAGKPIAARPLGPVTKLYRWSKRNPMNIAISGVTVALGLVIIGTLALGFLSTKNAIAGFRNERYANRIAQAAASIENGSLIDAEVYLSEELPVTGQADLRGWEWYYLKRKLPVEYELERSYLDLTWSPDGKQVASHELDGLGFRSSVTSIWSYPKDDSEVESLMNSVINSPAQLTTKHASPLGFQYVSKMAWDPNGRFLATLVQAEDFIIWDTSTRSMHSRVTWDVSEAGNRESFMQWSQDGKRLAIADQAGHIAMHSLDSKLTTAWTTISLDDSSSPVTRIDWGPKDEWLAISELKRTQFVNAATREVMRTWPISILGWSPDRTRWICEQGIGNADSDSIKVEVKLNRYSVFSPNGRWIASAEGNRVIVVNADSGEIKQSYIVPQATRPIWFPSSDRLLVAGRVLRALSWSPNDFELDVDSQISVLEASRAGLMVAIAHKDSNGIRVLDCKGTQQAAFSAHNANIVAIDWRSDDEALASLDSSGHICVWRMIDGTQSLDLSLFNEEIPKLGNLVDWQVHWSPDGKRLAACAAGSTMRVWDAQSGALVGELKKANSRIIGWNEDASSLNIQVYGSNSFVFPRQRDTSTLERSNVSRLVHWDVLTNSIYTYSTSLSASGSKSAVAWSGDQYYYAVQPYSVGFGRDTLESPTQKRASPSYSVATVGHSQISRIELADPPSRIFSLSTSGTLELKDVSRNTTLLRLPSCADNSLLSYSANKLWVADGNKLRLFDASTPLLGKGRKLNASRNFALHALEPLIVLVLSLTFVLAPLWIVADPGIQLSLSRRWFVATLFAASTALLLSQYDPTSKLEQIGRFKNETAYLVILSAVLSWGISAFFAESLRLVSIGRWLVPTLLWLCLALGALLTIGYVIWPSAWQLDQDPSEFLLPTLLLTIGAATFALGAILFAGRFSSGAYSSSFQFRNAPRWVQWALWGCKSMRSAKIITPLELIFYPAIVFAGCFLPSPANWLLIGIGGLAMSAPLSRIFAIRWLNRNGGWEGQFNRSSIQPIEPLVSTKVPNQASD